MKRAILIATGTLAGAGAVLGYQPGAILAGTPTVSVAQDAATTTSSAATTASSAAATASSAQTFTGDAVQTHWGAVQVQATVEGGQITDVTAIAVPSNDGHSAQLSAMAIPTLEEQAIAAQSSSIDGVSGASYTSAGFAQSLQSALVLAGLA